MDISNIIKEFNGNDLIKTYSIKIKLGTINITERFINCVDVITGELSEDIYNKSRIYITSDNTYILGLLYDTLKVHKHSPRFNGKKITIYDNYHQSTIINNLIYSYMSRLDNKAQ